MIVSIVVSKIVVFLPPYELGVTGVIVIAEEEPEGAVTGETTVELTGEVAERVADEVDAEDEMLEAEL